MGSWAQVSNGPLAGRVGPSGTSFQCVGLAGGAHCCPRDEVDGLLRAEADVLVGLDDAVDASGRDRGLCHLSLLDCGLLASGAWSLTELVCRRLVRLDAMRRDDKSGRSGGSTVGRLGATESVSALYQTGLSWLWAESRGVEGEGPKSTLTRSAMIMTLAPSKSPRIAAKTVASCPVTALSQIPGTSWACAGLARDLVLLSLNPPINRTAAALAPEPVQWTIFQRERIHRVVWRPDGHDRPQGNEREALVLGGKEAVLVQVNLESSGCAFLPLWPARKTSANFSSDRPELLVKHRFALDDVVGDGAFFGVSGLALRLLYRLAKVDPHDTTERQSDSRDSSLHLARLRSRSERPLAFDQRIHCKTFVPDSDDPCTATAATVGCALLQTSLLLYFTSSRVEIKYGIHSHRGWQHVGRYVSLGRVYGGGSLRHSMSRRFLGHRANPRLATTLGRAQGACSRSDSVPPYCIKSIELNDKTSPLAGRRVFSNLFRLVRLPRNVLGRPDHPGVGPGPRRPQFRTFLTFRFFRSTRYRPLVGAASKTLGPRRPRLANSLSRL